MQREINTAVTIKLRMAAVLFLIKNALLKKYKPNRPWDKNITFEYSSKLTIPKNTAKRLKAKHPQPTTDTIFWTTDISYHLYTITIPPENLH